MKIKIKSLDKFKENYEKLFELEKIIIVDEKKEYHYKDEYGKCKIVDKIDSIEIYRHGEINFKQIFKKDKNTSFTFITTKLSTVSSSLFFLFGLTASIVFTTFFISNFSFNSACSCFKNSLNFVFFSK